MSGPLWLSCAALYIVLIPAARELWRCFFGPISPKDERKLWGMSIVWPVMPVIVLAALISVLIEIQMQRIERRWPND